ncbi:MAG: CDP-alcohol phosphatidyltransferase family protein, partial [Clostridia bacterium]|nr:CDP-alcohol phosphatidyltransferase family protein [Clostridia bacterium]
MQVKWEWTVPNLLSLMRIALVPVFVVLYLMSATHPTLLYWAAGALVLSGLTDMFDGMIARALHQITEIGKLLDPIADKLTQVAVLVCLAVRMPRLWPLLAICAAKEIFQSVGATLLYLGRKTRVESARWYGKVCTVVFYVAMAMYVVFPPSPETPLLFGWNMPGWLAMALGVVVAVCMVY